jgi:hypothetical protein
MTFKAFTLADKANDLLRRSLSNVKTLPAENTGMDLADAATADAFTYGEVDQRGQQPGEDVVTVPQGNGEVTIFYNTASREARPVPVNIKDK